MLTGAFERSAELHSRLAQHLHQSEIAIPPYPAIAMAIGRLAAADHVPLEEITKIVSTDAALAATVLRRAASAHARTSAPTTLTAAIWKLGSGELVRLALTTNLGSLASRPGPLTTLRREAWSRALIAANLASELAARRSVAAEEAFLAGLLHDFGVIAILAALEKLPDVPAMRDDEWSTFLDEHHIAIGSLVATRWNLPAPIAEAIAFHHIPARCQRLHRPLVQLIAMVDEVITILERPDRGLPDLAQVAGLDHDERFRIGWLVERVIDQLATFEQAAGSTAAPSSLIRAEERAWPIDLPARIGARRYRATAISPSRLALLGSDRAEPGSLVEVALEGETSLSSFARIHSCRPVGREFEITVKPFALEGPTKESWLYVANEARTRHGGNR